MANGTLTTAQNQSDAAYRLLEQMDGVNESNSTFPATISVPFQPENALDWWSSIRFAQKFVWQDRQTDASLFGFGVADTIRRDHIHGMEAVIDECRLRLGSNQQLRWLGGFSFSESAEVSNEWLPFGNAQFWLPRITFDGDSLRCVIMNENDLEAAKNSVLSFRKADTPDFAPQLPAYQSRTDFPDKAGWFANIDAAMQLFETEVVEKIVLARKAVYAFHEPLQPSALAVRLFANTASCYHFCFQLNPETAFLGATPERLFSRLDASLLSEVVAGTRRRGQSEAEDQVLAEQLLASQKDQLEHDIVRKSIRQRLHKFVDSLQVDSKASILKLAHKQHLYSAVKATLKSEVTDGQLIDRLHPTPAVGGYPTENALAEIRRLETFDRGWYAAPVGWISADAAEFAVGIRSGLVTGNQLSVYSGAGIVPGSTAEEEWQEIEHKIRDFVSILDRDNAS
ncbi:MAG: isochorismate synthase [Planctomycetales bacterium]|nr:isochorismate synthase [Planctomycetales bacterium]